MADMCDNNSGQESNSNFPPGKGLMMMMMMIPVIQHDPELNCVQSELLSRVYERFLRTDITKQIRFTFFKNAHKGCVCVYIYIYIYIYIYKVSKAVPLHAMEALGGRGGIAPTHSRPRH
jgi:hypothetical protein